MDINQRQFFRFDVTLPCGYHVLTQQEADTKPLPNVPDSKFIEKHFLPNFTQIDKEIAKNIELIGQKSQLLSRLFEMLNQKIELLHDRIQFSDLSNSLPVKDINLSGNGMMLIIKEPVTKDHKVDVIFKTYPDVDPILIRCSVVNIKLEDSQQKVALTFDNVSEKQQRDIVYFLQNKEIELMQKARF